MHRLSSACAVGAGAILAALCWAQTPAGSIEGTVRDPSQAVVPGAVITVTEAATGRKISLTTNDFGRYAARQLLPGLYNVRIEAPGLAARVLADVPVSAGAVVNGDVVLAVGRTEQVVEVTAQAFTVDTQRQTVDTVITEQEIRNMPLFSRNFLDLAALAPGVNVRDGEVLDPTKARGYRAVSIAGRAGAGTRVQIDGIDVTDGGVGSTSANISADAVREFQVSRSSLDISTPMTSSGAVNVISRSGSNQIHGSWFWDYYNQDMGAQLDYNAQAEPFRRNRTGAPPAVRSAKSPAAQREPSDPHRDSLREGPRRLEPDAGGAAVLQLPARLEPGHGRHGGVAVSEHQLDQHQHGGSGFQPGAYDPLLAVRLRELQQPDRVAGSGREVPALRRGALFPQRRHVSVRAERRSAAPQQTYQDNYQNSYEGSLAAGRHTFRWGFNVTRLVQGGFYGSALLQVVGTLDPRAVEQVRARGGNPQDPLEYSFERFRMGPDSGFLTLRPAHGFPHGGHYDTRTAAFVGDSIRLGRRLTLHFGLRWEYDTGYFNNDRRVPREPALETWIAGGSRFPQLPKDLFMPSFGFAWDPFGSAKPSSAAASTSLTRPTSSWSSTSSPCCRRASGRTSTITRG